MEELSFWGWGYANKLPSDDARKMLGDAVCAMLGFDAVELRPVPKISELELPAPRCAIPQAIAAFTTQDVYARATHTYGKSYPDLMRGFTRDFSSPPDLVARPRNEREIEAVLETAAAAQLSVIPFGGGTSVTGGVSAQLEGSRRGVVSLDLRALDRVLEVDLVSRTARIAAGASGPILEEQLEPHGLTLRFFPQSFAHSTLGGWVATRAGGHFATLYTHIDDVVSSARMLTPSGVWESRTLPASGAGPSPDRFLLGSEGTLGVITEATVRLQQRPTFRERASVYFSTFEQGVNAARAIAQAGLYPANCRLLDEREANLFGVTQENKAVLMIAFESADHPLDAWMSRALELARSAGGEVRDQKSSDDWKSAFLEAPYMQSSLVSLGLIADTFETACTWTRFPEMHQAIISAVRGAMKQVAGKGRISCRFTHVYPDGPAPYYTFLAPGRRGEELAQWAEIKRAASEAINQHGGTITHHHSVGRVHRPWYERERPELFARTWAAVKTALDPQWMMNPGVLLADQSSGR